jgi:hypothetical protein
MATTPTEQATEIKAGMGAASAATDQVTASTEKLKRTVAEAGREFERLRGGLDSYGAQLSRAMNKQEQLNRLIAENKVPTDQQDMVNRLLEIAAYRVDTLRQKYEAFNRTLQEATRARENEITVMVLADERRKREFAAMAQSSVARGLGITAAPTAEEHSARAEDLKAWSAEIDAVRAKLIPFGRELQQYNTRLSEIDAAIKQGAISEAEAGDARLAAAAQLERQREAFAKTRQEQQQFLGSSKAVGWAMRDMGLQMTDVIQGIASGQPVMRTLIQQGGQIVQVSQVMGVSFKQMAVATAEWLFKLVTNPITAFIAAVAAVGAALYLTTSRASDLAAEQRALETSLESVGKTATVSAAALADYVKVLDRAGASRADANAIVNQLSRSTLGQQQIGAVVSLVPDTAVAANKSFTETATLLTEAANGSYDAIIKLNDAIKFLNSDQLQAIKTALEHGDRITALTTAFGALGNRVDGIRQGSLSPMGKAFEELSNGWSEFMDRMSKTSAVVGTVNKLAEAVTFLADLLRDKNLKELNDELARSESALTTIFKSGAAGVPDNLGRSRQTIIDDLQKQIRDIEARISARTPQAQATVGNAASRAATGPLNETEIRRQQEALAKSSEALEKENRVLAASAQARDYVRAAIEAEAQIKNGQLTGERAEDRSP